MAEIVSFYSYKGGVGRSLTLANVAALLANAGKQVVCIDFDLEAGGLHTIFGLELREIDFTLLDVLTSIRSPDIGRAMLDLGKLMPKRSEGKLWLLPTISEAQKVAKVLDPSRDLAMLLGQIVHRIEEEYNPHFIFIDSRSGFADLASASIQRADRLVCVLRPNRQNADGLRFLLDILATSEHRPDTFLVLSQVPNIPRAAQRVDLLESMLGPNRKFGAQIPYDPELALEEAVVAFSAPKSTIASCYGKIADWLEPRL